MSEGAPRRGVDRRRLRYIWQITRQGPTEFGYAYFRARRRRRNLADDEPQLSESDMLAISGSFDATDRDLAANAEVLAAYDRAEHIDVTSIQWFLPYFEHPYFGGVHTILRFADHLAREHGVVNRFHVYDTGEDVAARIRGKVVTAFPSLASAVFTGPGDAARTSLDTLPECDLAIATLWTSAYALLRFRRAKAKAYFVQDFEPGFYAAGSAYALAEETYRFGFPGLVNTPGLAQVYRAYGNRAAAFVPAVDTDRYHPPARRADGPVRVFFYGRPGTSRNSFGLGLVALAQLKKRYGAAVDIVCAGEEWNPAAFGVADRIRNLGVLGDLDAVAGLYRRCDIGLVFMLTKHPSYQPFEFMASGMATVSNLNPYTSWFLRDGENCLVAPALPTPVANRIGRLVDDPGLRRELAARAVAEVGAIRWDEQIEHAWRAITKRGAGLEAASEVLGQGRRGAAEVPKAEAQRAEGDGPGHQREGRAAEDRA